MELNPKAKVKGDKTCNAEPTFKKMTLLATIKTVEILKDCCETRDGFAVYMDSKTDAIVAESIKSEFPEATENGVARIRREIYGNLKVGGVSKPAHNEARLDKVERAVQKICADLGINWEII